MFQMFKANEEILEKEQIKLGLIITKQIIEASNGKLDFISKENVGSMFSFAFEVELNDG